MRVNIVEFAQFVNEVRLMGGAWVRVGDDHQRFLDDKATWMSLKVSGRDELVFDSFRVTATRPVANACMVYFYSPCDKDSIVWMGTVSMHTRHFVTGDTLTMSNVSVSLVLGG